MRIAIVAGTFNEDVVEDMVRLAERTIEARGHQHAGTMRVPGAFDTPLSVDRALARDDVDGVVVLGAIIQGETKHDEVIAHATAKTLQELAIAYDKPVGFGITGPGMTHAQAKARVDAAARAVHAVAAMSVPAKET